jgi:FNIP Repeat
MSKMKRFSQSQIRTRSVRRKLSPSLLDTLCPILSLLYSFLDDKGAFRFFRANKNLWKHKKSYHIKTEIILTYNEIEDLCFWNPDNTTYPINHHLFPSYLFSQIEKLSLDYATCCFFLSILEAEDPDYKNNIFLRELFFVWNSSLFSFAEVPPDLPHRLPSRLTSLGSYHASSFFDPFKSYAYFSCLKTLQVLCYSYSCSFPEGSFPPSLTSLSFQNNYNQRILPNVLPASLIKLQLGWYYDTEINEGVLPNSLQTLICGSWFNQPLPILPSSLVELVLGSGFRQKIPDHILPSTLESLYLDRNYNQPLPSFPPSFRKLEFEPSSEFNQSIVHAFPPSFRILIFGEHFNQPLNEGILNIGMEKLVFGENYDTQLPLKSLPSTLQQVFFELMFNQPILPSTFPPSLQRLEFGHFFNQELNEGNLPQFLKCLVFNCNSHFDQVLDTKNLQHLTCLILPENYTMTNLFGNDIFSLSFFKSLCVYEVNYYDYKARFPDTKWKGRKVARNSKTKLCQECLIFKNTHYCCCWEVTM